jgi:hypothetical protein
VELPTERPTVLTESKRRPPAGGTPRSALDAIAEPAAARTPPRDNVVSFTGQQQQELLDPVNAPVQMIYNAQIEHLSIKSMQNV